MPSGRSALGTSTLADLFGRLTPFRVNLVDPLGFRLHRLRPAAGDDILVPHLLAFGRSGLGDPARRDLWLADYPCLSAFGACGGHRDVHPLDHDLGRHRKNC